VHHSATTTTMQSQSAPLSKNFWNRMLGGAEDQTSKLSQIRDLDEIVMGTMTSARPLAFSSSSSSTYPGMTPLNESSQSSGDVSEDPFSRQSGCDRTEREVPSSVRRDAGDVHRAHESDQSTMHRDNSQRSQHPVRYRTMMNEHEKGFEVVPQDKVPVPSPQLERSLSEALSSSSSSSRYDPTVLRRRAALSERLHRQQEKIEQLQRELSMSCQRRTTQAAPTNEISTAGDDRYRDAAGGYPGNSSSRVGLDERRRTQAMLNMLDTMDSSLWNSKGFCESEDSVLRISTPTSTKRTPSRKRSDGLVIIRE
jgi:hypothetical protein